MISDEGVAHIVCLQKLSALNLNENPLLTINSLRNVLTTAKHVELLDMKLPYITFLDFGTGFVLIPDDLNVGTRGAEFVANNLVELTELHMCTFKVLFRKQRPWR